MAASGLRSPYDDMPKRTPGVPVQNTGGFAPNTAPIAQRPVTQPAVKIGAPGPAPLTPSPNPSGVMPAPAQTPVPAPAPAPAAAPPAPASVSSALTSQSYYGSGGGVSPGTGKSLEDTLRNYIGNAMGGVTSKAFVDRAKNALGAATEGQRQQRVNQINQDAVARGIYSSGIPAELAATAGNSASNTFASKLSDILNQAEQQDIAGRESAAGTAGNLLSANRSYDFQLQQLKQEEADRAAAAAAGNRDTSFVWVDPDTGQSYTMDESWFQ